MNGRTRPLVLQAVVGVFCAALFLVDLMVPLGVAVWLPYVAAVMLSLWFPSPTQTYVTAAVCTVLTILGLYCSPPGFGPFWLAMVNRLLGIFALWITAVVGLTARRTLELQEANRQLQQEIVERERLQAQLLRTQRLESVGVLASGIAHDFNNLLTPILMAVKLLKEDRPEDEHRQLLTILQTSAERGADVVRQLLAFAGGIDGERVTFSPQQIIQEIKAILEHTVPKAIQIDVGVVTDLQSIHADATQLCQVLINLCINARDAMPLGGRLTIEASNSLLDNDEATRLSPDARPGPYVEIAVADTGVGIPADVLDLVFDPFFTTKGPGQGTGLGLSTALGIVRGHGGFFSVSSQVGKGSRFSVYLPVTAEGKPHSVEQERPRALEGHGELIMVVDDEALILATIRQALESRGYRVVTASDGAEAVALYQRHEIQAVILDMMMPGMDGWATMTALETLDSNVRIIATSGLQVSERLAESAAGRQGVFLPKPYTDVQMLTTLAQILAQNEGER